MRTGVFSTRRCMDLNASSTAAANTASRSCITNRYGLDSAVRGRNDDRFTDARSFRSIQILCERGLHDDASALVQVLMETTVAVMLILRKASKRRPRMFHAYKGGSHAIAVSLKRKPRDPRTGLDAHA